MGKKQKKKIKRFQYCLVEHTWRFLRALCIVIGTICWLYGLTSNGFILGCYITALVVDQFHGFICEYIEKILHFQKQHFKWD